MFTRFNGSNNEIVTQARRHALWFAPGIFFILIGAVALIAPQLVIAVFATVFFFIGCVACVAGWKLMQLKSRVEKMARQFEGKVFIQGVSIEPPSGQGDAASDPDQKKIVFH